MPLRQIVALSTCVIALSSAVAGPLDPPPGPIASTPRIEARTPISATTTPGDASSVFRITQPGSYYLTANVTGVAGRSGIAVAATGPVTIDLNGFTLSGVPGALQGISDAATVLTVVNGTVINWPADGVFAHHVDSVISQGNGGVGISVFDNGTVTRCTCTNNGSVTGAYGIAAGSNTLVSDCIANFNGGAVGGGGIVVGSSAQVHRCVVLSNAAFLTSGFGYGISAGFDSVIADCRVNNNGASGVANSGGISANAGTNIVGCSLYNNKNAGITTIGEARIVDNSVGGTTAGTPAAGIYVNGQSARVDGNHLFGNTVGIRVIFNNNVIVRNSVRGSTTPYDIVGGNDVGPVGAAATSTSPWANLQGP